MMTDRQLQALINYIVAEAQHVQQYAPCPDYEVVKLRKEMVQAFGFEASPKGYPITPQHPNTQPPVTVQGIALTHEDGRPVTAGDLAAGGAYLVDLDTGKMTRAVCSNCGQIMEPARLDQLTQARSIIASLLARYSGVPDYTVDLFAEGRKMPVGYEWMPSNTALAIRAARALLKENAG
jgi:hypothetical protein